MLEDQALAVEVDQEAMEEDLMAKIQDLFWSCLSLEKKRMIA